jgi:hypothetical protein
MKWIGQHIYDLVARFRNDVYLEDISTGTIASGGNLGLDSNNKIVKATSSGGIAFDGSTANGVLTYKDSDEATVESNLTFDGSNLSVVSATEAEPVLTLKTTHTTANRSGELQFLKDAADTGDGERLGLISFYGEDSVGNNTKFAHMQGKIAESDHGSEGGTIEFAVASHDGDMLAGLTITDGDQDAEVDVTVGGGTASVTTIAGTLTMGSTATLNNSGLLQVANQSNITGVGTISSGTWQGTSIATTYTAAKVTSIGAGDGIDINSGTGDVTITAEEASTTNAGVVELATTAETTTGTDTGRAVTPDGLKDGYQGSTNVTTLGTIGTGVWQGTAIASAYLDSDTAHLSTQKHMTHHSFTADIDTTKTYVGLVDADSEATSTTGIDMPLVFPVASKLLQVTLRSNKNLSALTYTWRLETQATGVGFGTGPTIVGTQSGSGPAQTGHTTYDFTTSLDSGDNIVDAFDAVYLSLQSSGSTANTKYYITCVWETDMSGY